MNEIGGKDLLLKAGPLPGLEAELSIGALTFEAKILGVPGNDFTMEYATGGAVGAEIVTVTIDAIKVQIDPGVSTAKHVKAALDNFPAAYAKIKTIIVGSPDELQVVVPATNFAFGYDPTTFAQMLGGLRTKKITLGSEEIDVTNHSSDEFKTLLDRAGIRSFSMDGGGVVVKEEIYDRVSIMCEKNILTQFSIVDVQNQITRKCLFKIPSLEKGGDYNAAQTYGLKMSSSGRLTKNKATAQEMDPTI